MTEAAEFSPGATIEERLIEVLEAVNGTRDEIRTENERRKRQDRRRRNMIYSALAGMSVALVVAIVAVSVAVSANNSADRARAEALRARAALETYKVDNARARKFSCDKFNVDREDVIAGLSTVLTVDSHDFVEALISANGPPSAEERALADRFNATHDKLIHNGLTGGLKLRDCSPAGIAAYLGQAPPTTTTKP